MAEIRINGVKLEPQPFQDEWSEFIIDQKMSGTDSISSFKTFKMACPVLAGQAFNWDQFENQELVSLQAYEPGDLPTGLDFVYSSGVVSRKIQKYTSPIDRSIIGVELEILVNTEATGS